MRGPGDERPRPAPWILSECLLPPRRAIRTAAPVGRRRLSTASLATSFAMNAVDARSLLAFNAVLLAAVASPGPALLLAMRTTLAGGRRAGLAVGAGLATVAAGWTLVALLGLDAVFRWVPWAHGALKAGGAAYLLYLAWRTWRSARQPVEAGGSAARRAFRDGVVVNLANPKSVLFAAAVIVVLFPKGLAGPDIALIAINHLLLELALYGALALALASGPVAGAYLRAKTGIDRLCATLLGALGLKLLFESR